jgi:quinolinate synthase
MLITKHITAQELFEKLKTVKTDGSLCAYSQERCARLVPLINAIQDLKTEKNAIILAHSYVHPDIIYGVADFCGDSYGLAQKARQTDAEMIVFPAVRFMAETAKILNPNKIVIDPNIHSGCTLADSIDSNTVYQLREQYPSHTFVCYVNTTAAVKAACDLCVTSSNAYSIVEKIPNHKIYFLPDKLMGQNIHAYLEQKGIDKEFLYYHGTCYVHEQFDKESVIFLKKQHPGLKVLAHPECKPEVVQEADLVSSTTGMIEYVKTHGSSNPLLLLTECGIATRLFAENPELNLVGSCMMCKYMKSNHLENIYQALKSPLPSQIIKIDPEEQAGALRCMEEMFRFCS